MKKILSLILSFVMLFSFCACGESKRADKYCWNCGEGVSSSVTFCEHCGVEIKQTHNNSSANSDSSENTSSTGETSQSSTPPNNVESSQSHEQSNSTHIHSYTHQVTQANCTQAGYTTHTCSCGHTYSDSQTPAIGHSYTSKVTPSSCSSQGYTTYTCHCGNTYKDNYTNPSHSYSKYKCTKCGTVDKTHAYEYLVEWVKANGTADGEVVGATIWVDLCMYNVRYSSTGNYLYVSQTDEKTYMLIDLSAKDKKFSYFFVGKLNNVDNTLTGKIDGPTFSDNSPISCDTYQGITELRGSLIELARLEACVVVAFLRDFIDQFVPEITIQDIGFNVF